MKRLLVLIFLLCSGRAFCVCADAATITVGSGKDCATIALAAAVATAGHTVDVYAGSYAGWTQTADGTAGNPITFQVHTGEAVTITSVLTLSSANYVTFTNFPFSGTFASYYGIIISGTNSHIIFQGLTLNNASFHVANGATISNSQWLSNTVVWDVGFSGVSPQSFQVIGDNNLLDGNTCTRGQNDCLNVGGTKNVFRNNTFTQPNVNGGPAHIDYVQTIDNVGVTTSQLLMENNSFTGCTDPTHNCHVLLVQTYTSGSTDDGIITRYNTALPGTGFDGGGFGIGSNVTSPNPDHITNFWSYNNTIATGYLVSSSGSCFILYVGTGGTGTGTALNNICHNVLVGSTGNSPIYKQGSGVTLTDNSNIGFTTGYSGNWASPYSAEATYESLKNQNALASYPTSAALSAGSPALGAGVKLTTIAAGGCSGTTINLTDAHPFQDGWGPDDAPVNPDWIRIGTSTTRQFAQGGITYATGITTVTAATTCSAGDPVYLYKDSDGTQVLYAASPDIGASPYTGPWISRTPTSIAFADQQTGTNSAPQNVTVTCLVGPCTIGTSTLATGTQFTITGDTCDDGPVATNATCTVSYRFNPTTNGAKSDTGTTASSAPGVTSLDVALSGTGIAVPNAPTATMSASVSQLQIGQTFTLTWSSTNATSGSIIIPGVLSQTVCTDATTCNAGGTVPVVCPSVQYVTYYLVVQGAGGSAQSAAVPVLCSQRTMAVPIIVF